MRKVAFYATLILTIIGAGAILPGVPIVREAILTQAIGALPDVTLTYDESSGNAWTGINLTNTHITHPQFGELHVGNLAVSYYLPAVLGGELPLTITANDVAGDLGFTTSVEPVKTVNLPRVTPLLRDIAISGVDVSINGIPFALSELTLDDVHAVQTSARTLEVSGTVGSDFGAVEARADIDLLTGEITGDITKADLGFTQTWWPPLVAGRGHGSFYIGNGDIEAMMYVSDAALDLLDLGLTGVDGVVHFAYPVLEFDVHTSVLGGAGNAIGVVDFDASHFEINGEAVAPLSGLANWIGRSAAPDGLPVEIGGDVDVSIAISGWDDARVDATGSALGALLGFPLIVDDVEFAYYEDGNMRLDVDANFTGSPLTATMRPAADGTHLRVTGDSLNLFTPGDTAFSLFANVHTGYINTSAGLTLSTTGEPLYILAELDGITNEYSFYADAALGTERIGTGAFAVDGLGHLSGQIGVSLPLPGNDALVASGTMEGTLSEAAIALTTESPGQIVLPIAGAEINAIDPRGTVQANITTAGFTDIHGHIGNLDLHDGTFSFLTQTGEITASGFFIPELAGNALSVAVHDVLLGFDANPYANGALGLDLPILPSTERFTLDIAESGEVQLATADGAITVQYGDRGLRANGRDIPVVLGDATFTISAFVREVDEAYLIEVTIPAGTEFGGVALRHDTSLHGTFDPATSSTLQLAGASGTTPLHVSVDATAIAVTAQDSLRISMPLGDGDISVTGETHLTIVDDLFCFGNCDSTLGIAGSLTADAMVDINSWKYGGTFSVDLADAPVSISARADEAGNLRADILLVGASEPLLTIELPTDTPPVDALTEVFSGGLADFNIAGVHLPRVPWDVQVDLAMGTGVIRLPDGEFHVQTIDGELFLDGSATIPLEAGGLSFSVGITVHPTAVTNLAEAQLSATLHAADGTVLVNASGTPSDVHGRVDVAISELAALLGQEAIAELQVDGDTMIRGDVHINAVAGDVWFSASLGNITASGTVQNGIPSFIVSTEGAEITAPNVPPLVLTGALNPDEPLDATLAWHSDGMTVTANIDYSGSLISATVPASHIAIEALGDLTGEISATFDLASNTLQTSGAYFLSLGSERVMATIAANENDPLQLRAEATFAEYAARWELSDPTRFTIVGPDVVLQAEIGDPITVHGTAFEYDVEATLHLEPHPRANITSSALPGELIVAYDDRAGVITADLTGDFAASAALTFVETGLTGTVTAFGETAAVEYEHASGTVFAQHDLVTGHIELATLNWEAAIAYEQGEFTAHATATGTALTGAISGYASLAGITAAVEGDVTSSHVTLIARGEEVAGTTLLATLDHDLSEPLTNASVQLALAGAMYGDGDIRFVNEVPTLQATVQSDILPGARVVVDGAFEQDLVLSLSGEGALDGRLLYQNAVLSGSMQLDHDIGTVDAFIMQDEAHITVRTPYLPGGSLFTIVPLERVPNRIRLDGLGTIVGEVIVDLTDQYIELANVSAHHDVGTLRVNQVIPFAGPYTVAGEVHIPPLERPIPIAAALNDDGLRLAITGVSGDAFTVIPTDAGPISELTVQLNDFALPLVGADALPLTGEAMLGFESGISLTVLKATSNNVALVGDTGFVPDLHFHVNPTGAVTATTAGYTFTLTVDGPHISVREAETGGGVDIYIVSETGVTTVDIDVHNNLQFLAGTNLPISDANLTAQVVVGEDHVRGTVSITDVVLSGLPVTVPYLSVELPETPFSNVLDATVDLSAAIHVAGLEALDLIGNASLSDGVPSIDLISSSGQQISGTLWPLDVHVTSIGALQGTARVTSNGVELDELYLEIDQARVLMDGSIDFGALPTAAVLGQIAYRDAESEYPASLFSLTGMDGTYTFTLGEETNGLIADITLTSDWEPTARVTITDFVMQLPAFDNTLLNGDIYVSAGSMSGSSTIRIGDGSVHARGSVPFTDIPNLLGGATAANAEISVHQLALTEIPFLGIPEAFSGAVNGTIFLRGGTVSGQFIVPSMFSDEHEDYVDVYIHGANGTIEATTSMYGSVLTLELVENSLNGSLHLEQFPIHDVASAFTTSMVPEVYATGFARLELPLQQPRDLYVRIATEAINIENAAGERGTIDISAVLENERLEVQHFNVTGLGTWQANGILSEELLDFTLDVQDAALGGLLQLIPALQPFQPELTGSFAATATGSVSEPRIQFSAPQLIAGISGSRYELLDADLSVHPAGVTLHVTIEGSDALDGRLEVRGTGAVGTSLFDVRDMELTVNGDLAVPTVGLVDDITGTVTIAADAAPTVNISGYLGNRIELTGTLDPLDVALRGSDIRLALPVLMVQDTRLNPDLRIFMGSEGLSLSGELRADFLTLDPGLRAKQLQESEEAGTSNPLTGLHLAGVRVVVPQRLSFVNSLATIEGAADITATGPLTKLELEGSAEAIRGVIRFSGRDFELAETAVTFSRTAGIYPHIRILARTRIEKSRITSGRDDIVFVQPTGGQTFDIDLLIAGDVTPAPLEPGGFTFDVSPVLSSNAVLEISSATGGRTTHTFSNDELLTLAVLGRLDLSSSVAGSGNFGTAVAQGVIDSALDVLIVSEIERALKAELGFDLLELRTSSLSALASQGAEPFGVSLKVGGYLDDGLFATYQISTLDRGQYGPVLMNQVGLQYDWGPVVFDVAARIYSPNDVTLFETVPELGVAVRYDFSQQLSATGAVDLSADRFAVRFGVTLVW